MAACGQGGPCRSPGYHLGYLPGRRAHRGCHHGARRPQRRVRHARLLTGGARVRRARNRPRRCRAPRRGRVRAPWRRPAQRSSGRQHSFKLPPVWGVHARGQWAASVSQADFGRAGGMLAGNTRAPGTGLGGVQHARPGWCMAPPPRRPRGKKEGTQALSRAPRLGTRRGDRARAPPPAACQPPRSRPPRARAGPAPARRGAPARGRAARRAALRARAGAPGRRVAGAGCDRGTGRGRSRGG